MQGRFVEVLVTARIKLTTNSWVGKPLCGGSFQSIGVWCNGNTIVSKTIDLGSIPCTPASRLVNVAKLDE